MTSAHPLYFEYLRLGHALDAISTLQEQNSRGELVAGNDGFSEALASVWDYIRVERKKLYDRIDWAQITPRPMPSPLNILVDPRALPVIQALVELGMFTPTPEQSAMIGLGLEPVGPEVPNEPADDFTYEYKKSIDI